MGIIGRPKHLGVHEHCVKVGSCFVKIHERCRASWPGALQNMVYGKPSSLPPTFHNLQADLSAQQTGIGRVVPESARSQVELVDEGGALVESVVDPEIELRIGEPARAAIDPVADIDIDRRPRIHSSHRDQVRLQD